ncbi:MAG: outer membrane lipid asymmetry maintenance protein MlaD [Gammaproteobacteria bacterium]|nr:outer membrane lipid asymmetry maintenance protein MlaD [Gammaproteobacteria bacterium]
MIQKRQLELWVGVFVAAGLLALAMLAFRVGNLAAGAVINPYSVQAEFNDIGGLTVRAPVTLAGVRIGRVSAISLDSSNFEAKVTMELDGRYNNIPVDTSASILTAGLLGAQYVALDPGGATQYLKNGSTIQVTQSALVLEKIISQFLFNFASKTGSHKK